MKQTIFYILYLKFKEGKGEYVPVFAFMGETFCKEVNKWGFVSHECSARASEMFKENYLLFQRATVKGKSGARYYSYRINPQPKPEMIKDPQLLEIYKKLRPKLPPAELAAKRKSLQEVAEEQEAWWQSI